MATIRSRFRVPRSTRNITITCRGKPIGEEELFRYTNGRFLINEEHQSRQRYVKFNIPRLCAVAAAAGNSESPIVTIEKMEGGFCKALLMKKADGTEVVAKLPSKLAGPPKYSTASEVATLKYGRPVFKNTLSATSTANMSHTHISTATYKNPSSQSTSLEL
ncbi:hypothetical protein FQN49_006942 [Arthroderma sp. PD_2]|nr:hypothetical protein FQN49_006942 [Arthroderma sp. PD_2]